MDYNNKLEKMPYTEEERKQAEIIYNAKINNQKIEKIKFTTGLFSAYVDVYSNGEISLLSAFSGMQRPAMYRHNVCGHEWEALPERLYYKNAKCPECRRQERINRFKMLATIQHQEEAIESAEENDVLAIKEDIAEKTIEEAMLNKPRVIKKTSDNSISQFLDTVEPTKLNNTERLLNALNSPLLIYGAYSTRSKALLLYTLNHNASKIEMTITNGDIDVNLFEYKKLNATISRYDKLKAQYEFYNTKAILHLISNSNPKYTAIFNDAAQNVMFCHNPIPDNILTIKTNNYPILSYNLVMNIMRFAIAKKLLKASDVNSVVMYYINEGYRNILNIIPYLENR